MAVTDAVSVMRRGEMVKTLSTAETSPAEIAELMVGRRVLLRVEKAPAVPGPVMLDVEGLRLVDEQGVERLRGIGLTLRAGEILGVAGVAGNGQSELLEVLAGVRPATSGNVRLKGEPLDLSRSTNAGDRRELGIAHIPEDRHRRGLVMAFDEWENSCLGYQGEARFRGPALTLDRTAIRDHAREAIERFDIRPASCDLKTANFSGGNQPLGAFDGDIDVGGQRVVAPHPARIDAKPRGLGQQELARGIAANAGEQRRPLAQPRQRQRDIRGDAPGAAPDAAGHIVARIKRHRAVTDQVPQHRTRADDPRNVSHAVVPFRAPPRTHGGRLAGGMQGMG